MGQSQSLSHIPDGMCKHCFELRIGHSKGQWKTIWILEGCQEHLALLNSIIFDKIEQNCFGTLWFSGRKLKLSFCLVWMQEKRQDSPPCLITVHGHSPVTWHKKRGSMFLLSTIYLHLDQIQGLPLLRSKVWQSSRNRSKWNWTIHGNENMGGESGQELS